MNAPLMSARDAAKYELATELSWLRTFLNVHVRRLQRAGLLPGGANVTHGLFVAAGDLEPDEVRLVEAAIEKKEQNRRALLSAECDPPIGRLARRFGLDADDRLILLLALANELAPDFARVFAFMNRDSQSTAPTLAMTMEALVPAAAWTEFSQRLDATARLYDLGLVTVEDDGPSRAQQAFSARARIVRWVAGDDGLDRELEGFATLTPAGFEEPELVLSRRDESAFARAALIVERALETTQPLIVLTGAHGSGRSRWARALAARQGRACLVADIAAWVAARGALEDGLRALVREARLHDAVLALAGWDTLVQEPLRDDDAPPATRDHRRHLSLLLERVLKLHDAPTILFNEDATGALPELARGVERVYVATPDLAAAETLWRRALGSCAAELPAQAAAAFNLTPGQIASASAAARRDVTLGGERITLDAMARVVKTELRHRLGDIATLVEPRYRWSDLVCARSVSVQLKEIIARYANHSQVFDRWGFAKRFGRAVGMSALFEGPPGTGKTMAASLIASELGLDLFQVDLSRVISKYIGETEKQLANLFDEAERARAVLLFDEADSLFSKRTEVKSSNDRYANLKVNFLLQRIERFTGIAILTTNFPESMDDAFGRRVTVRIRFENPDAKARRVLWDSMLAFEPGLLADDIDLDAIAKDFELTGGTIKNAVLRAAYMAAARKTRVDHELLSLSARIELKQAGKLLMGDPISDLADLPPDRLP